MSSAHVPGRVDLAVYGATAGGCVAAIAGAGLGMHVALVDPGRHVGGMLSGGLARTDIERQEHLIGGLAGEVFGRIGRRYGSDSRWRSQCRFEPHVAEQVLREWLDDAGIAVVDDWPLAGVERRDGAITELVAEGGARLSAACFVDASYEGDLLACAGVTHAIGREDRSRHGETLAGRAEMIPNPHQFSVPVSALAADGGLLPGVQPYDAVAAVGAGDGKVQSYCYRLCLTDDPARRLDVPEPDGYDPDRFLLLRRYLAALGEAAGPRHLMGIGRLPNGKADINSGGPVSTNLLGASWRYPEADRGRREQIAAEHLRWAHGLLFFLQTDPAVPGPLQAELRRWGLAADEFTDSGHWPPQLYVRDARRMVGEHVLTQPDLEADGGRRVPDAVGLGGYNIDIREVQWVAAPVYRFPDVHPEVLTEGYVSVPVGAYPIPYRTLLPRREDCRNLLVSTCVSASHVAFASFRMEPQFMIAGHAAGVAAALAVDSDLAVHDIDVAKLQAILRAQGQLVEPPSGSP